VFFVRSEEERERSEEERRGRREERRGEKTQNVDQSNYWR
jgi:hypothetical protein